MKRTDKAEAKRRSMPLRVKLICYFLAFAAVLLSVLWVFQVWLFDDAYRLIKNRQLETAANNLAQEIESENLGDLVVQAGKEHDMTLGVYKTDSQIIYELYTTKSGGGLEAAFMPHHIYGYYSLAKERGGRVTCPSFEMESELVSEREGYHGGAPSGEQEKLLVSARLVTTGDGEYMILTKAPYAPFESTVETMRIILLVISAVFVVVAILVAIIAAWRLSKPIRNLNRAANELAKQNYAVSFDTKGFRETEELGETLSFAAEELSKVDALRRELIANISHDLRTPLTMIGGYAEVMRDIPGENTPENLQIIVDETEHLSALVTDLLSLSRLEAGSATLEKAEYSLTESIRSIFSRYSKYVQKEELTLKFEAQEDVWVYADELKLSQVIYNLINNAINYSSEPKAVLVRQSVSEGRVLLEVIDNGKGIPKEELRDIWDRYYRGKDEHKIATVGTGLGLSIVKNILLLHEARFGVKSKEGVGSNFWFEIDCLEK